MTKLFWTHPSLFQVLYQRLLTKRLPFIFNIISEKVWAQKISQAPPLGKVIMNIPLQMVVMIFILV